MSIGREQDTKRLKDRMAGAMGMTNQAQTTGECKEYNQVEELQKEKDYLRRLLADKDKEILSLYRRIHNNYDIPTSEY